MGYFLIFNWANGLRNLPYIEFGEFISPSFGKLSILQRLLLKPDRTGGWTGSGRIFEEFRLDYSGWLDRKWTVVNRSDRTNRIQKMKQNLTVSVGYVTCGDPKDEAKPYCYLRRSIEGGVGKDG